MSNNNKSNISNKVDWIMDDDVAIASPSLLLLLWSWWCMIVIELDLAMCFPIFEW